MGFKGYGKKSLSFNDFYMVHISKIIPKVLEVIKDAQNKRSDAVSKSK